MTIEQSIARTRLAHEAWRDLPQSPDRASVFRGYAIVTLALLAWAVSAAIVVAVIALYFQF